ncbi:MAG: type II toxin-antitoxin system VapC family toxin [Cyanobacteria bacterium]|nr:type II toxin-antitoxin system VapC family toxin [Cyanobacteriota bacterium]
MQIICDTHIPLFWANAPSRLSRSAAAALEKGRQDGQLAIADISLWEIALLHERGRLRLPDDVAAVEYLSHLLQALRLNVLPITANIAVLSRSSLFQHGDPADRLIAATALHGGWPLITADEMLRALPDLHCIW